MAQHRGVGSQLSWMAACQWWISSASRGQAGRAERTETDVACRLQRRPRADGSKDEA